MNARAALQNGARASAIKPNNKGHSKNSRAEAGKGTYTQFEPARTYTQIYNLKSQNSEVVRQPSPVYVGHDADNHSGLKKARG